MKFQGKTYQYSNPTVRDLAHQLKLRVEKGTYRSAAQLQNSIIDDLVPDGWPADTHVRRAGNEVSVCVGPSRICVAGFSHKVVSEIGTGDPTDVRIKVRRNSNTHVATADGGMSASATSGHQRAADALVFKFFSGKYKAVRAPHHDKKYRDAKKQPWEQVQCFNVVKA